MYWQDTFKVKTNLTLNYGLRYEYPSAIYQTRQQATNFVPGVGAVLLDSNQVLNIDPTKKGAASFVYTQAPFTLSNSGVSSDKNNFAPVVGMAYTPRFSHALFGNDDTVIRAGFRVGYDETFNNIPANMGLNAPYNLTTNQTAGVTQPGKFPWAIGFDQSVPFVSNFGNQGPGHPTSGVIGLSAIDPNLRTAYIYQFNFGIQRRLGNALLRRGGLPGFERPQADGLDSIRISRPCLSTTLPRAARWRPTSRSSRTPRSRASPWARTSPRRITTASS